ncbi:MAG TPA: tagatose-6-phosphate ketose isomerase [Methylomirabilota bacterium]|jgi:tagatose-6-phosphate ketose/aldose isomerase|nr:tagatose-6-phosphate ketose isomerase [Methylomirabilota bacterium]
MTEPQLIDGGILGSQNTWQRALIHNQLKAAELFARSEADQKHLGYFHTLREICQQPETWLRTCDQMVAATDVVRQVQAGIRSLALTGSGSSQYAGECVCLALQNDLNIQVASVAGGTLLTYGGKVLPPERPGLVVSLARSGDSPESRGAIELLLKTEPDIQHVVVTCNEHGSLTKAWREHDKVRVFTLPRETNDESLVMTSSFTNLLLAARFMGMWNRPDDYAQLCRRSSSVAEQLISENFDVLVGIAKSRFQRVVFLGTGPGFGAAREAALKMLEMTAGRVTTLCETYLGFRHGPMSYVQQETLIVAFLSSSPTLRAYEVDLLQQLDQKKLGLSKLIVGDKIPAEVLRNGDVAVECPGLAELGDQDSATIHVVVAQLLGFFRCLEEGLRPDSPSQDGIIQRVVGKFTLHGSS